MSTHAEGATAAMKVATAAQYAGSGSAVVFGLSPGEWQVLGIIVGIAVGVGGFVANVWFRWKHYELAKRGAHVDPA